MPDISCCNNENCPLKIKCYRFTAPRSHWQSFCDFQPTNGKCEDFWDNTGRQSRFDMQGNIVQTK